MLRRRRQATPEYVDPVLRTASAEDLAIVERCAGLTLIGPGRLLAVIDAVRYCVRRGCDGALVECGVWKGGAVLAMLLALEQEGVTDRDVYLFDTFEGMTEPSAVDTTPFGEPATTIWSRARAKGERAFNEYFDPADFGEAQVREVVGSSGYPAERLHLVTGRVEDTVPGSAPERIALLRLDTDWYESTRHELEHLWPRIVDRGVLIVDDYGHWDGARRAVDEFAAQRPALLWHRSDYSGRVALKA